MTGPVANPTPSASGVQNRYHGVDSARQNLGGEVCAADGGLTPTRPFGPRPPRLAGAVATPAVRRRPGRRTALVLSLVTVGGLAVVAATGLRPPARPSTGTATAHAGRAPAAAPGQPVVEHGGHRYAMGRRGDVAVLGDWDCDGTPTPALYRPSTGEAFVFRSWAEAGRPVRAARAGRHPRGGVVSVVGGRGGCDRLSVRPHENA